MVVRGSPGNSFISPIHHLGILGGILIILYIYGQRTRFFLILICCLPLELFVCTETPALLKNFHHISSRWLPLPCL